MAKFSRLVSNYINRVQVYLIFWKTIIYWWSSFEKMGRVPFNQRFWFAFPDISRGEWMPMNNIFWDFLNKGQLRELYPKFWNFLTGNFRSSDFPFGRYGICGWMGRISDIFGCSSNFSRKLNLHTVSLRLIYVKNFWLSGKRAWLPRKC